MASASTDDAALINFTKLTSAESYQLWNFDMLLLLKTKKLWKIVNGVELLEEVATDEEKKKDWLHRDAMAQSFISRTVDKTVKSHILTCETAKEMYDTLKVIFARDSVQLKQRLLRELHGYTYD